MKKLSANRKTIITRTIVFLLLLFAFSCSDGKVVNPIDESPELTILSPLNGAQYTFGDSVSVTANLSGSELSSSTKTYFIVNGYTIDSTESRSIEFLLDGIVYRLGESQLVIKSATNKGSIASDTVNITISSTSTPVYKPIVHNIYPHDNSSFTQGLQYHDNYLYEGTGLYSKSKLRKLNLESGEVVMERKLSDRFFGEGITIIDDKIYQLTWNKRIGFIYSLENFDSLGSFSYETEGWGLTATNEYFLLSDGSTSIHFHDFENFAKSYSIKIRDKGTQVKWLNELELIKGDLFANVLHADKIARISLSDDEVIGWLDLSLIASNHSGSLNGIAYRSDLNRLLITGKNWDSIYEIDLSVYD